MNTMQIQRIILWVIFSMSVLFLWDGWQRHNGHPSMFGGLTGTQQTAGQAPPAAGAKSAPTDASVPPTAPAAAAASSSGTEAVPAQAAIAATKLIRLGNDVLALDIDPMGGQIRRAELLKHRNSDDKTRNVVLMDDRSGAIYLAQSGLIGAPEGTNFPTHRSEFTFDTAGPVDLSSGANSAVLKMSAVSGGVKLQRTYTLERGSYLVQVRDDITNVGTTALTPTMYMQLTRDEHKVSGESRFYSTFTGPAIYTEATKFKKISFGDIESGKADHVANAPDGWVGMIQHYFVSAWVPAKGIEREFYTRKVDTNLYSVGIKQQIGELAPGATKELSTRLYIGPQDQNVLEKVSPGLDLVVDYGWLTVVAKPIYWLLEKLHSLVGNWGWAIVLLTIVVKTMFFPLQAASYRSMARMKAVAPRLATLKERFGDDRVKMNQAMMELYKQEKINPLGGCLPIVVQIPVFISLYWVLLASVEMRNAPWLGWIHDLAAPDPYYILPLVMAITMFVQVKLNPTPPDPMQAKMMMLMPLVFSVMFFFFPSGLVLYWLVNNVYSIAQQWVINRKFLGGAKKA